MTYIVTIVTLLVIGYYSLAYSLKSRPNVLHRCTITIILSLYCYCYNAVIESQSVSVRAAAAEIIAADFYAAPTDSLLLKKFGSSCRQQNIAPIVC